MPGNSKPALFVSSLILVYMVVIQYSMKREDTTGCNRLIRAIAKDRRLINRRLLP